MPPIPLDNKIHTVSASVNTENKGSAQANAGREAFTIEELINTIPPGGAVDSVQAGDGITVDQTTGDVTVSANIGALDADDYIAKFTADDAVGASRIYCNTFTEGSVTYENFVFGASGSPALATFPTDSSIIMQTQAAAPTSASTPGRVGQVILYHGDETDADNGIYVCVVAGVAGAAKWTKSALTNV